MKYALSTSGVNPTYGGFPNATTAGRSLYISGQIGIPVNAFSDETARKNNTIGSCLISEQSVVCLSLEIQVQNILRNCQKLLQEVNCSLGDVAQAHIYLTNLDDYVSIAHLLQDGFGSPMPALSVVEVSRLPCGAQIMIDCVACR